MLVLGTCIRTMDVDNYIKIKITKERYNQITKSASESKLSIYAY
jgi:hypothetical protein